MVGNFILGPVGLTSGVYCGVPVNRKSEFLLFVRILRLAPARFIQDNFVRRAFLSSEAITPSLKTHRFACTRRPVWGKSGVSPARGHQLAGRFGRTHFDAEVRQLISTPRPQAAQETASSPEQRRAVQSSPEQAATSGVSKDMVVRARGSRF